MENGVGHKCNGRCELCNVNQRTYCAAQMAYYAQQEIYEIKTMLNGIVSKKDVEEDIVLITNTSEPNASGADDVDGLVRGI